MNNKITYLAIPYTWNPNKSFEIANKIAAKLMKEGKTVFSPISHSHPIADYMNPEDRISQEIWMNQDIPILSRMDEVIVVLIGDKGKELIDSSKGCTNEIKIARELGLKISYYKYKE